jgi:hypothetical protein
MEPEGSLYFSQDAALLNKWQPNLKPETYEMWGSVKTTVRLLCKVLLNCGICHTITLKFKIRQP